MSFVPQLLITLLVIVPLAIGAAMTLNYLVDTVLMMVDRRESPKSDEGGH